MSDVLRNLQEFRKEKEKARLQKEQEQLQQKLELKPEEKQEKNEKKNGTDWRFLTTAEPVAEDYEEEPSAVSPRTALALYLVGQGIAAWAQFGCVFLILSLIVFTYWNTGRRRRGEMSAYSVFNQNCERLAGSMTAEHFERDMLRQRR